LYTKTSLLATVFYPVRNSISNGVYLPIGLFFFGQLVATGQVSQASAASISKPKAIVSPQSHCQPSDVWFVKTLLQNGHLSILKAFKQIIGLLKIFYYDIHHANVLLFLKLNKNNIKTLNINPIDN
jgi:hypothetical protein